MARLMTTAEVAAFTGLDERTIRKDVEHGIFGPLSRPRFAFPVLVYFRTLVLLGLQLGTADRKRLYKLITQALAHHKSKIDLSSVAELRVDEVRKEIAERLERFDRWKTKLVCDEGILAGEPVFPRSRLAVRHVGAMLLRGAPPETVLEDYPYLKQADLDFAKLYTLAYPRVGRPREPDQAPAR